MKKILVGLIFIWAISYDIFSQNLNPKGLWKFDDSTNLTKAEIGSNLELIGLQKAVSGPSEENGAVEIGVGSYYRLNHSIQSSLGAFVNEYSLQIDFMVSSFAVWHCFFQTNTNNENDGDCFINTNGKIGVGATGYSNYSIKPYEWYRLIISVKNGTQYKYYLDGQLLLDGSVQDIDGRFSLDKSLLIFADEDGEDGIINCAEIAIWDKALTSAEVNSLGGFGHIIGNPPTRQLILSPYLQLPTKNSVYICWHDTLSSITKVEYGTTPALGLTQIGTNEIVISPYRWHTVKLTGLEPNTEYFYKAISESGSSEVYSFRTLPDDNFSGKIRFLLLSDTHNLDTVMAVKVIKEAKKKIQQLYGDDIQNHVNFVLHSGDLVVDGSNIVQWTDEYFAPMSPISANIPFITVTGNHEGEHANYYNYMHYEDISPFPAANERFWSYRVANTLFIGLNSNASSYFTMQKIWLDQILTQAEADTTIDFVFVVSHHFSITELWGEGITFEPERVQFITNSIYPILKKYSKVIQHSYGHTHGFERGTIDIETANSNGGFRIVCGGGGGGATDRWGVYQNTDFPNIQISLDNYFFQLIEIDVANKTFESSMYSLGNSSKSRNSVLMDKWYKKLNQPPPENPVAGFPTIDSANITFNTTKISSDSLMSVRIQISDNENFISSVMDTIINWKNIFGVDSNFDPIDLNKGLDLTKLSFPSKRFISGEKYFYRVKYRDHNMKWSGWSNVPSFDFVTNILDKSLPKEYFLGQNFPNPFNPTTTISYQIPLSGHVLIKVFNLLGQEVETLVDEEKKAGKYNVEFNARNLSSGIYFYELRANNYLNVKKLVLLQ